MPNAKTKRALLVCPTSSPFMEVDRRILDELYALDTIYLDQDKGKLRYFLRIAMLKLKLLSSSHSVVFIWFADYHAAVAALLSRILGKRVVTFIGGYDAVCYPQLGMGVYCSFLRGICAKTTLRCSHLIIANHQALIGKANTYYKSYGHLDGIQHQIPRLKAQTAIVPNALLPGLSFRHDTVRQMGFLSVGTTPRFNDIFNKGYDLLMQIAALRPDWQITIIGIDAKWMDAVEEHWHVSRLPNLSILPPTDRDTVLATMLSFTHYVQASISEGMPNALMEAMCMGCIPIGSDVAAIPDIIASWGVICKRRGADHLIQAMEEALLLRHSPSAISESITARYGIATRQTLIATTLQNNQLL